MKLFGWDLALRSLTAVAWALILLSTSTAKSAPANSLRELYAAVGECVQAPTGVAGSEITVIFSIKSDGSLLGKPKISHSRLLGDTNDQKSFVADVFAALSKCFPINITAALGGAVAGRPLAFRIISRPREIKTWKQDVEFVADNGGLLSDVLPSQVMVFTEARERR